MRAKNHSSGRLNKRRVGGAAAVELAFVSIPLIFMALAAIDFARAMFVYDQLTKSARDGARYLSFSDPDPLTNQDAYNLTTVPAVKERMVFGKKGGTFPIVPGLTEDNIVVCDRINAEDCPGEVFSNVPTDSGPANLVKVSITGYSFTPIFPGISTLTTFTFEPISVTMRQLY